MKTVGLDLGYSAVKAVSGKQRATFPSVVGPFERAGFSLGEADNSIVLTIDGTQVLVGQGAIEQSRFASRREDRDWIKGSEYKALMLAAFSELVKGSVEMAVVTGLPLAFYQDADKTALEDALMGEHRIERQGRRFQTITVETVRVIPQPFGSLLCEALDNRGDATDKALVNGNTGIVDVGGKTTNLLSANGLREIVKETASVDLGAWDIVRGVRALLSGQYPELADLDGHRIQQAIRERSVKSFGEAHDLTELVDSVLDPMAGRVLSEATQLWNGAATLDTILITGGGAHLLGPHIKQHFAKHGERARIVADPAFANAVGYWKLGQRMVGK